MAIEDWSDYSDEFKAEAMRNVRVDVCDASVKLVVPADLLADAYDSFHGLMVLKGWQENNGIEFVSDGEKTIVRRV